MGNSLTLSWFDSALSPNARKDRRHITGIRSAAREEGLWRAKAAKLVIPSDALLAITFCPPNNIRRDLDNCLASIKPHLDGIAKACEVDDAGWSFLLRKGPVVSGGAIHIAVIPMASFALEVPLRGTVS